MIFICRRIWYKIYFYINFLLILPFFLIFTFFSSKKIKFIRLRRDVIGNSIEELYLYLNIYKKKKYHYFFFDDLYICNDYLQKIFEKNLNIIFFGNVIYKLSKSFKFFNKFMMFMPTWHNLYKYKIKLKTLSTPEEFKFTKKYNNYGDNFFKRIGVINKNKIVCLVVRDSAYKKNFVNNKKNWDYQNYRDANIESYLPTIKYLNNKGYYVIRMGKISNTVLKYKNPFYYDYSNSKKRTDFLDFWIYSKAFFTITTGTGLDELSSVYNIPTIDTNYFPVGDLRSIRTKKNISIFKKIKNNKKNNFLTLSEMINLKIFSHAHIVYQNKNLKFVDNTKREILSATIELISLIRDKLRITKISKRKEENFWKIIDSVKKRKDLYSTQFIYDLTYVYKKKSITGKISPSFIKNNNWILK